MQHGSSPSRYHAFLLRLSQPEPGVPWQIVLKETNNDQDHTFQDLKSLFVFLEIVLHVDGDPDSNLNS